MIEIEKIKIEEFRGIRDLTLNFNKQNFGICGPNGTGKSGVVDAIEFGITGDITRLGGRGTSDVSVKAHAPHVDQRTKPEKAKVTLTARVPSINVNVTIERSVRSPKTPKITPDNENLREVFAELEKHPELALSRREIIKYILTPPGDRSKEVQALLRLDKVEKVRRSLTTVANKCKSEAQSAREEYERSRKEFGLALGITELRKEQVLQAVNDQRKILGLPALTDRDSKTSLREGVTSKDREKQKPGIHKRTALAEVESLRSAQELQEAPAVVQQRTDTLKHLEELKANPALLRLFQRQAFYKTGLDLIDEDACPLCDVGWNEAELRDHLAAKIGQAASTEKMLKEISDALPVATSVLKDQEQLLTRIIAYCNALEPKVPADTLMEYLSGLASIRERISRFVSDPSDVTGTIASYSTEWWAPPKEAKLLLREIETRIKALPELSKEEEAKETLIRAQDRFERVQSKKLEAKEAESRNTKAQKVLVHYDKSSTTVLTWIYKEVEQDFTRYYRFINRDDESKFEGKLLPSLGKLGFEVDFYGRGLFPPGAYHSEGHQDGMGLCLYLALMKHTLKDNFTFAVLDDVLMSVDAGHRREVCRLLKQEFPQTQFVLTTHDQVWLQYMKTEQLIKSSMSFGGWSVETGPRVWDDKDIWEHIDETLAKNDIPQAASALRRYLEYTTAILADELRARVEFHGYGQYDLGDLMPPVIERWKYLLKKAIKAAKKWKQVQKVTDLTALKQQVDSKVTQSGDEQWAINKAVHFTDWADLQKEEFELVVAAFKELLETLRCDDCGGYFYVQPNKGASETLRCSCGNTAMNLKEP
ncbi:MAG: AAA family ATPase [Nitrososphaera sp.]|nr:AAA family ATPase [Nitrososphaera sp.]